MIKECITCVINFYVNLKYFSFALYMYIYVTDNTFQRKVENHQTIFTFCHLNKTVLLHYIAIYNAVTFFFPECCYF